MRFTVFEQKALGGCGYHFDDRDAVDNVDWTDAGEVILTSSIGPFGTVLGEYETAERASDIVDDIIRKHTAVVAWRKTHAEPRTLDDYRQRAKAGISYCYHMPEA